MDMKTARVEIRPVSEPGRSRFLDLFSDSTFMVFSRYSALGKKAANLRFDRMLALSAEIPFCKQAIIETATGVIIGYAGVDYFEFLGTQRLEFGYRLVAESRGHGFATEAGLALLALAREMWHGQLFAFIDPHNHASRNVLGSLDLNGSNTPASRGSTLSSTTSHFEVRLHACNQSSELRSMC
jgi:RimJ/RimL family protein N-acetyltransferase